MTQAMNAAITGHNEGAPYDVDRVRADFPILSETVYGKPLVYFDNGASAQKPRQVIDAMRDIFEHSYTNVHRGAHFLSQQLSERYESVRDKVAGFINAPGRENIVFTRIATEAINLVAASYGRAHLRAGDEIVISAMEHHANIVPWQMLCEEKGTVLKVAPIDANGALDMDAFAALLGPKTKLVAMAHCSNVLGTVTPAAEIARLAHAHGAVVLFDGAQSVVHMPIDVQAIDADFYVFTGHKLYGPNAIGVLYGKADLLESMPPYQGGGDMIERVTFEKTTFQAPPYRFEAGTPPIVETIGLGVAIDYVNALGMANIAAHERELCRYATARLDEIGGIRLFGRTEEKAAILSFVQDGIHPMDTAMWLDRSGVAVRVGQHCAEPLMSVLGVDGTVRASLGLYNTKAEVDVMIEALQSARAKFA